MEIMVSTRMGMVVLGVSFTDEGEPIFAEVADYATAIAGVEALLMNDPEIINRFIAIEATSRILNDVLNPQKNG